ncbi:hypothetical protein ACVW1C_005737 [Bradyrhizobium sp. USDA 4011]
MEARTLKLPTSVAGTPASLRRLPVTRRPSGHLSILPQPYAHGDTDDEFDFPNGEPTDRRQPPFADCHERTLRCCRQCWTSTRAAPGRQATQIDFRSAAGYERRLPGRSRTTPQEARSGSPRSFRYPEVQRRISSSNQEAGCCSASAFPPRPGPFFRHLDRNQPVISEWSGRLVEGSRSRWRYGEAAPASG